MNIKKVNSVLGGNEHLIKKKSRNLKTQNNLFNPVSEFGLGVQVIKLNK